MEGFSVFRSHRQEQRLDQPWVLLGRVPRQDVWIAIGPTGPHIVDAEDVEDAPHLFVRAKQLPPGTREYMRPVEPTIEVVFAPKVLPPCPVPEFRVHTTLIEKMVIGTRGGGLWHVYCGYDTLAHEWVVAGEPQEVSDV